MLELRDVSAAYGQVRALHGISLNVQAGEVVTLIGANGAGKSTTLRVISGLLRPRGGTVTFEGRDLTRMAAEDIVALGVSHVPEGRHVFPGLSVRDNLRLGAVVRQNAARGRWSSEVMDDLGLVIDLFPPLQRLLERPAWSLSGGEQQMLAIGRGLMARPKLLLLDEPSLGLAPLLVRDVFGTIARINRAGTTVLLVEQNARQALRVAQRAYVLETGRVILQYASAALLDNEQVRRAYLGSVVSVQDAELLHAVERSVEHGAPSGRASTHTD
ncbi:MAG: ABC transporter ATP-binding protein [Chloroflexota bacterium]